MFWAGYIEKVGTGTEDIVNLCKERGLKTPEYHQEEDFRVIIWRKAKPGSAQSDPNLIQIDPNRSKSDPNHLLNSAFVEKVFLLIKEDHRVSRKTIAERLNTSERKVRQAIDLLRNTKIRRVGTTRGEWEIIEE